MKNKYTLLLLLVIASCFLFFKTGKIAQAQSPTYAPSPIGIKMGYGGLTNVNWTVTSSDGHFNCNANTGACSDNTDYVYGDTINFTISVPTGYVVQQVYSDYGNVSGQCGNLTGTSTTCTMTVGDPSGPDNLDILITWSSFNLSVNMDGTGSGTVTSSPSGIYCPGHCSANFPLGSNVTLQETPANGSTFLSWGTLSDMGMYCQPPRGKAGDAVQNVSHSCSFTVLSNSTQSYEAVAATFNPNTSTSSSGGNSVTSAPNNTSSSATISSTSSRNTASSTSTNQSNVNLVIPPSLGFTLWNGNNFGKQNEQFKPSNSKSAALGIANNNDVPLATVNVDLASKQDWSKSDIVYATDQSAHKAFVHGLTNAPGVVGGIFTLFVPYNGGDKYVGVCPGATSLSLVGPNCNKLYYLTNGQTKTHRDNPDIPVGVTVKASIVTINNAKYWMVSGLTGTGGFSSPNSNKAPIVASYVNPQKGTTDKSKSNHLIYIILSLLVLVVFVASLVYKLWLPRIRNKKTTNI